mmetsp:Transcript_1779/g.4734  ORF Transcript_1779/g.4734 Transcript_1779/m.4734 type:complete len:593 (-) Transcript_1779:22-1800(-)
MAALEALTCSLREYVSAGGGASAKAGVSADALVRGLSECAAVLRKDSNVVRVSAASMLVVGDLHGQLSDLLCVLDGFALKKSALHNETGDDICQIQHRPLVFLGDYVDRGAESCEVLALLCALKMTYPSQVMLLRGNHESRAMVSKSYKEGRSFSEEVGVKYGDARKDSILDAAVAWFDTLPLAAVLEPAAAIGSPRAKAPRFLCCHGGLGPSFTSLSILHEIDRFSEPPLAGPFCDCIWSDPLDDKYAAKLSDKDFAEFLEIDSMGNPPRGCSVFYGYALIDEFLTRNELDGIIRGHQVPLTGFREQYRDLRKVVRKHAAVTTVFSASNYCGTYGNEASVALVSCDGVSRVALKSDTGIAAGRANDVASSDQPANDAGKDLARIEAHFEEAARADAENEKNPAWTRLKTMINARARLSLMMKARGKNDSAGVTSDKMPSLAGVALAQPTANTVLMSERGSGERARERDSTDVAKRDIHDWEQVFGARLVDVVESEDNVLDAARSVFDGIDTDRNGELSREEVTRYLASLRETEDSANVSSEDAGGMNIAAMREHRHVDAIMDKLDLNADNSVSFEEFFQFFESAFLQRQSK